MKIFRTGFLLIMLSMLLVLIGGRYGGPNGMTLALAFAVLMNGFAYFFSDKIALMSSGAQPVTREQMPKLYVIPQAAPNAFATGRNPSHASVAVTQGLMQLMDDEELEGVIAHELSHVRNYDILTTSIAATVAGAITWIARMGFWFGGSRDDERGGGISGLLMLIAAPIAAMLIQLGISREREYAADETGARMVGHPYGLIRALEKLGAYNKRIPMDVSPATSALFIVKPLSAGGVFTGLFSTHPPLEERIAALRSMATSR